MCGIAGGVASQGRTIDPTMVYRLLEASKDRGDRGFGVLTVRPNGVSLRRQARELHPAFWPLGPDVKNMHAHTLAPTSDHVISLERLHPFETERFYMAHNGIIVNKEEVRTKFGVSEDVRVDSAILLHAIHNVFGVAGQIPRAVQEVCNVVEGQMACWLFDRHTHDVYLWRVMSPIWLGATDKVLYYGSIHTSMTPVKLDEGVVYQISVADFGVHIIGRGSFEYTTPYKV